MPYILNTPSQIREMLGELNLTSVEELFSHLPPSIRIKETLSIPGFSEKEVVDFIKGLAKKCNPLRKFNSFLGGGIYFHYLPSALKHILGRAEFYTAYTPYQPEISQGILQALFEYQSYICILTGMDVTNASLYDGATALAEGVLMSLRIKKERKKVLVAQSIHPEYRQTLFTYFKPLDFEIREISFGRDGFLDLEVLKKELTPEVASLVFQSPNFFGLIEDAEEISKFTKEKETLLIQITNPLSLALLKEPASLGVDIVCGEGQVLGGASALGGGGFGFLATKQMFLRQLPGRIVGETKDREGKRSFCLTLQAREQHIRRERATSNICSNHSLNAIGAAVYLSLLGKEGFKEVALYSLNLTHYLFSRLQEIREVNFPFAPRFFNEFVWGIESAPSVLEQLYEKKIIAGLNLERFYPHLRNCILSTCTEMKSKEEIDEFVQNLEEIVKKKNGKKAYF